MKNNHPNNENDEFYADSIVQPGQHYRLRQAHNIVGFMNIRDGNIYYSRDNFSWSTAPISYDNKERSSEVFDHNRQMIFENDLVKLQKDATMPYTKRGLVVWNSAYRGLVIKLLEEDGILMLDVPSSQSPFRDDLNVISHLA